MTRDREEPDPGEEVAESAPLLRPTYGIDERPASLWESLLYGWQHTLVDISPFVLPLAVAGALGLPGDEAARWINACLVAMGIATLIQTTVGNRLPIIQGPSATLTGTLAPLGAQLGAPAMWGGVFIGGLLETLVGAAKLPGMLRRYFPPAVSGVVIVTIGFALGGLAVRLTVGDGRLLNFALAAVVVALIALLQIVFRRAGRGIVGRGAIFFSIWVVGVGLGSLLGEVDWSLVADKPWFGLPRLFPYGGPGFGWELSAAAIFGVAVGFLGSMVESLGDYAATCQVAGERYETHHMNRGIAAEGMGSLLAACIGAIPVTSYTQNIGIIAATGVASRFVVRIAAGVLLLYGLCPKFGALLVALPRPVLGGVFIVVCGMIVLSGIQLLSKAEPTPANAFLAGVTLITAIGVPTYVRSSLGAEWLDGQPALIGLLLTNPVVLAVVLAMTLNLVLNVLLRSDASAP